METTSTTAPRPATSQGATPPASSANRPLAVLRFGAVSAAVFENEFKTPGGIVHRRTISLRRSYRDAKGVVRYTSSLRPQDLLFAAFALLKCFDLLDGNRHSVSKTR